MPQPLMEGIDVSVNQGHVDWSAVKQAGKAFAFARASLGGSEPDSSFATNWQAMGAAGIPRGAYHFFWPLTPWQAQADNFIRTVGTLQPGDLPPVLDLEEAFARNDAAKTNDFWQQVPQEQRLRMIQGWLDAVQQALGVPPIIYTRQNFIEPLLNNNLGTLAAAGLWIAHYTTKPQPSIPAGWTSWTFWQYSESGTVAGVHGKIDCNRFSGSPEDLKNLAKS